MRRVCHVLSPGYSGAGPGEKITRAIIDYIQYAKSKGCVLTGPESMDVTRLNVLKGE